MCAGHGLVAAGATAVLGRAILAWYHRAYGGGIVPEAAAWVIETWWLCYEPIEDEE
jgi:hypothetical protein